MGNWRSLLLLRRRSPAILPPQTVEYSAVAVTLRLESKINHILDNLTSGQLWLPTGTISSPITLGRNTKQSYISRQAELLISKPIQLQTTAESIVLIACKALLRANGWFIYAFHNIEVSSHFSITMPGTPKSPIPRVWNCCSNSLSARCRSPNSYPYYCLKPSITSVSPPFMCGRSIHVHEKVS